MAVPTGTASLLDIQNEFGGSNPISLDEYYGAAAGVPTSGTISINDFRGKSGETGVVISSTLRTDVASYPHLLTLPDEAEVGDFCVITYATRSTSSFVAGVPTGWTRRYNTYSFTSGKSTVYLVSYIYYRTLSSLDPISYQFAGVSTSNAGGAQLLLFKPVDPNNAALNPTFITGGFRDCKTSGTFNFSTTAPYSSTGANRVASFVNIVTGCQDGTSMAIPSSGAYTNTGTTMQYSAKVTRNATLVKTHDYVVSNTTMTIPWATGTTDEVAQNWVVIELN